MKNSQSLSLFILRVLIGWHFLYEGLLKVLDPDWSSVYYLTGSQGIFSTIFKWIAKNEFALHVTDIANQWGLLLIGLALMMGLFTRASAICGMILLILYYLCAPPWTGLEYAAPIEGNNLIVNKTLIEVAALFVLAVFPAGMQYGLDIFRGKNHNPS